MIKRKVVIYTIIVISIYIGAFYFFSTNQTNAITALEDVNVNNLDEIKQLESPDKKHKLTIYLNGGVFMKSDYSYIGQLSSKDKKEKEKFILWLPGEPFNIQWVNNKEILVNQKQINISSENYDFRNM
ncbi:hypothetical protein AN960_23480 [Bacillus sp. FJAT-25509]|uniref:DUF5412 family protein n=1 Tax=Bacillaceae TaxID=186817 RepID=UPI0006FC4558|nr:DUF5412 family protein [Bacillus sp. FJAT-25509]KQL32928.1 hypothetical protein AN960_23480 [Bacillus sp. FJAT-25509]